MRKEIMIQVAKPEIGDDEIDAVVAVLRSGALVQGKVVAEFEERFADYIGVKHAVAVSTGTAALHLALLAHGVGAGDEVITTPFTFVATANAVLYTGATPVFVDICTDTFNLDPNLIEEKITPRTKAILPVHLYGYPADMESIGNIAEDRGLAIIEDAAQAHGAAIGDRKVGTFGTGCFSFYATKNLMTAEGGMLTTNDGQLDGRLRMLRSHGQSERYHHDILGYNYRLTDLQAAIGLIQLGRLERMTQCRIANAEYYNTRLRNVVTPPLKPGYRHVYHQYTVRVPFGRDEAVDRLNAAGVGTGIHYPIPIHHQKLYRELGYRCALPVSEEASRNVLSLPVHPGLTSDDLAVVVEAVSALPASDRFRGIPLVTSSAT
jgi:perosamine synthetase